MLIRKSYARIGDFDTKAARDADKANSKMFQVNFASFFPL